MSRPEVEQRKHWHGQQHAAGRIYGEHHRATLVNGKTQHMTSEFERLERAAAGGGVGLDPRDLRAMTAHGSAGRSNRPTTR